MARHTVRITDKDRGWAKLKAELRKLDADPSVEVGVMGETALAPKEVRDGEPNAGLTVADVATIHEFGAPGAGIPERSFIRSTADEQRERIHSFMKARLGDVVKRKMSLEQALGLIGQRIQSLVMRKFVDNDWEENAQATIDKKDSSKPLIDTSQLRNSIRYRTRMKRGGPSGEESGS